MEMNTQILEHPIAQSMTPHVIARLVDQTLETHNTKSYFFESAQPLSEFKAGSHINIEFDVDGEPVNRTYTLSSSPKQHDVFSITVKRIEGGLASNWLFNHLEEGDSILVSQPQGQFVLPRPVPGRLLMLSAGSGITPLMSMLRYLTRTNNHSEITFLHYAQSSNDFIFGEELKELAARNPNLKLHLVVERGQAETTPDGTRLKGRISRENLSTLVPRLQDQEIYLCGPTPFMSATTKILDELDFSPSHLHQENFTADSGALLSSVETLKHSAQLTFSNSNLSAQSAPSRTILEEAETRGLSPSYGCRMGICRTCLCQKGSGVTVNILTGEESGEGPEYILPCISVAKTNTVVAL